MEIKLYSDTKIFYTNICTWKIKMSILYYAQAYILDIVFKNRQNQKEITFLTFDYVVLYKK